MVKAKEFSLDLRKRIVNAHLKGEGNTKLSKRFQVSRTGIRGIIKKFKGSSFIQNSTSYPGAFLMEKNMG